VNFKSELTIIISEALLSSVAVDPVDCLVSLLNDTLEDGKRNFEPKYNQYFSK
jgi:hypothetical protein